MTYQGLGKLQGLILFQDAEADLLTPPMAANRIDQNNFFCPKLDDGYYLYSIQDKNYIHVIFIDKYQ